MAAALPDDLLHMICGFLGEKNDFDTLYRCVLSGKQFAIPALSTLYRISHVAPATGRGADELEDSTLRMTKKWASIWRSIVLSCLGKTLFPYSQFIRALELENLHELLRDSKFQHAARIQTSFFAGDLAKYKSDRHIIATHRRKALTTLDIEATLNSFAEVIIPHVPMLEELRGPTLAFDATTLSNNIAWLPHFRTLNHFHGGTLEGMGSLFNKHCPHFHSLHVYGWSHDRSDEICADFLSELRPNSMTDFGARSSGRLNTQTFLALNHHKKSLESLQLEGIPAEAIPNLSNLSECTNLKTLLLAENSPPTYDLESRNYDRFLKVVAWLRECTNLREIGIKNFLSGPALVTPVLLERDIKLVVLTLDGYAMANAKEFHEALASQTSLQRLFLNGEGVDVGHPDNEVLVEALCGLTNLKELQLRDVSDGFTNAHILRLTRSLSMLKVFGTTGYGIDDEIWAGVALLPFLQSLELNALSRFTVNGILEFIWSLGDGNRELNLSINMQDNDCDIPEAGQTLLEETIVENVNGRFGLTFWKGSYPPPRSYIQDFKTLTSGPDPDADDYSVESD